MKSKGQVIPFPVASNISNPICIRWDREGMKEALYREIDDHVDFQNVESLSVYRHDTTGHFLDFKAIATRR